VLPRQPSYSNAVLDELKPAISAELDAVPQKYREALILFHLEGHSLEQTAAAMNCPLNTVSSRLARGRELLKSRLRRRGVVVSAVALTASLTVDAGDAEIPKTFVASTLKSASLYVAGHAAAGGGAASSQAVALAKAVLNAMFITKLKLAACVLVVLFAAGASAVAVHTLAAKGSGEQQAAVLPRSADAPQKDEKERPNQTPAAEFSISGTPGAALAAILQQQVTVHYVWRYPCEILEDLGKQTGLRYAIPEGMTRTVGPSNRTLSLEGSYSVRQIVETLTEKIKWDLEYREDAIAIWKKQDEKLLNGVQQTLDKKDLNTSILAIRAMRPISDPRVYPLLARALASEQEELAGMAIDVLNDYTFTGYMGLRSDSSQSAGLHRVDSLACSESRNAIAATLLKLAGTPPPCTQRDLILHLLQVTGDSRALEPVLPMLKHPYLPVRIRAIGALGESRDPAALAVLRQLGASPDLRIRVVAAYALSNKLPARFDMLMELFRNNSSNAGEQVRKYALRGLKNVSLPGDPRVVDLVKELLKDTDHAGCVLDSAPQLDQPGMFELLLPYVASGDQSTRCGVADALAETHDDRAIEPLSRLARDPNPAVRSTAIGALGKLNRPNVSGVLMSMFEKPDPLDDGNTWQITSMAAKALGDEPGPKNIDALMRLYKSDPVLSNISNEIQNICDPALTEEWIARGKQDPSLLSLVSHRDPRRIELLLPLLGDPDARVRKAAFNQVFYDRSDDARFNAAIKNLATDPDPQIREAAENALPQSTERDLVALASGSASEKKDAARCLLVGVHPEAVELLAKLYADSDPEVSKAAGGAIWQLGHPAHIEIMAAILKAAMLKSPAGAWKGVVDILLRTHSRKVVPILSGLLESSAKLDADLLQELMHCNGAVSTDGLAAQMKSKDRKIIMQVREALAASEDPRAVDVLIPFLKDPDPFLRACAVSVLGDLSDPRADDAMIEAMTTDKNRNVRGNIMFDFAARGDERGVDLLIGYLKSDKPKMAAPARESLRQCCDNVPRVAEALKEFPEKPAQQPASKNPASGAAPSGDF